MAFVKSKKNPYENFLKEELILRDQLAIDRTILANERTVLSYVRTSLALIAAGGALIHFFSEQWIKIAGVILVFIGGAILIVGYLRYRKMDRLIKKAGNLNNA